jgi:hypothetical protein
MPAYMVTLDSLADQMSSGHLPLVVAPMMPLQWTPSALPAMMSLLVSMTPLGWLLCALPLMWSEQISGRVFFFVFIRPVLYYLTTLAGRIL